MYVCMCGTSGPCVCAHTHSHSLVLSNALSLSLTHTHTYTQGTYRHSLSQGKNNLMEALNNFVCALSLSLSLTHTRHMQTQPLLRIHPHLSLGQKQTGHPRAKFKHAIYATNSNTQFTRQIQTLNSRANSNTRFTRQIRTFSARGTGCARATIVVLVQKSVTGVALRIFLHAEAFLAVFMCKRCTALHRVHEFEGVAEVFAGAFT
jgi:hypothetical protein